MGIGAQPALYEARTKSLTWHLKIIHAVDAETLPEDYEGNDNTEQTKELFIFQNLFAAIPPRSLTWTC
jgi:hypothetical protein